MKKNALLIIDPQNDFCNPGNKNGKEKGALYVNGAEKDMERLAIWINQHKKNINFIAITIDSHQPNDISHPYFWEDTKGNFPPPFTVITSEDVEQKKWIARFEPERCLNYLKQLEAQGEYPHVIWPVHCLSGSEGAAIYPPLMKAIADWSVDGKFYKTVIKGTFPFTEHFGAFRAQIPDPEHPETQLNKELIDTLSNYDNIYLAGEAKSHCVANSLKQILNEAPVLSEKLIVLEDAMSNVDGFETIAESIYQKAKQMGVRFSDTTKALL